MTTDTAVQCPICQGYEGGSCQEKLSKEADFHTFECHVCGQFEVEGRAFSTYLRPDGAGALNQRHRDSLSQYLHTRQANAKITEMSLYRFFLKQGIDFDLARRL